MAQRLCDLEQQHAFGQWLAQQLRAVDCFLLPADARHQHQQLRREIFRLAGEVAPLQTVAVEAWQQREAAGAILPTGSNHRIAGRVEVAQRTAPAGVSLGLRVTVGSIVEQQPEPRIIRRRRQMRHHMLTSVGALFGHERHSGRLPDVRRAIGEAPGGEALVIATLISQAEYRRALGLVGILTQKIN